MPPAGRAARDLPDVRARGGAGAPRRLGAGGIRIVNPPARPRHLPRADDRAVPRGRGRVRRQPPCRDPGPQPGARHAGLGEAGRRPQYPGGRRGLRGERGRHRGTRSAAFTPAASGGPCSSRTWPAISSSSTASAPVAAPTGGRHGSGGSITRSRRWPGTPSTRAARTTRAESGGAPSGSRSTAETPSRRRMAASCSSTSTRGRASPSTGKRPRRPSPPTWRGASARPRRARRRAMSARREVGPRSKEIVAREQRHIAPGFQSFALYSGLAMARGRARRSSTRTATSTSTSSPASPSPASATAIRTTSPRSSTSSKRLTFGSFATETRARFLDLLATFTPEGLTRIQFSPAAPRPSRPALRLAKAATGQARGHRLLGRLPRQDRRRPRPARQHFKHHLGPFLPGQHLDALCRLLSLPAQARAIPDCGIACADFLARRDPLQTAGELAAIIVEPIQGTAGNVIPPEGFLRALQSVAPDHGALLIADEMITGFGRTGRCGASSTTASCPTS